MGKIPVYRMPEILRDSRGEVKTIIINDIFYGWKFERAWYYWRVEGPGLPLEYAVSLHEKYGNVVRVAGHCGCPSPMEWGFGMPIPSYHVDTAEGLKALADAIKQCAEDAKKKYCKASSGRSPSLI